MIKINADIIMYSERELWFLDGAKDRMDNYILKELLKLNDAKELKAYHSSKSVYLKMFKDELFKVVPKFEVEKMKYEMLFDVSTLYPIVDVSRGLVTFVDVESLKLVPMSLKQFCKLRKLKKDHVLKKAVPVKITRNLDAKEGFNKDELESIEDLQSLEYNSIGHELFLL